MFELEDAEQTLWAHALTCTAAVGLAPILVLGLVPQSLSKDKGFLKILLGFALGGLIGDALLHLLPHSINKGHHHHSHDHHHHHDHNDHHQDHHDHHDHDTHDHGTISGGILAYLQDGLTAGSHGHNLDDLRPWLHCVAGILFFFLMDKMVRNRLAHDHSPPTKPARKGKKESVPAPRERKWSSSGLLNLVADFFHNFTDGLAIGATFRLGQGLQTTVAIMLHEIPHEIGDYAVLVESGFTKAEAMKAQVVTATGAMAGCCVGLVWGNTIGSDDWIAPVTAGGFLYIALATIIPSLMDDASFKQTILEVLGILVGVGSMVFIAIYME